MTPEEQALANELEILALLGILKWHILFMFSLDWQRELATVQAPNEDQALDMAAHLQGYRDFEDMLDRVPTVRLYAIFRGGEHLKAWEPIPAGTTIFGAFQAEDMIEVVKVIAPEEMNMWEVLGMINERASEELKELSESITGDSEEIFSPMAVIVGGELVRIANERPSPEPHLYWGSP